MSESDGGNQLRSGVQVSSGQPAYERFAPGRAAQPVALQEASRDRAGTSTAPSTVLHLVDVPERPQPQLGPGDVLLRDGRVVEVMETSPRHDAAMEKLLSQCGLSLVGLGAMGYTRAMAFCALYSVGRLNEDTGEVEDREPLAVPRTKLMWEERQDFITRTSDALAIVDKYNSINGMQSEGDFRRS